MTKPEFRYLRFLRLFAAISIVNLINEQARDRNIAIVIVMVAITAVSGLLIYDHDLWNPHEHRVGAIVKEMSDSGNLVVPTLNGERFLQKPPLYYATAVFIYKVIGGEPARTFRITSALYGLLTLLACARIGFVFGGMQIALASAAALATMAGFLQVSHFLLVDSALVAFVALSWWAFVEYQQRISNVYVILVWVFAAGAFLSKGIIGIGLTFPGMLVFVLWTRGWQQIFCPWQIVGLIAFAAVSAIWLVPLALYDGGESFRYWAFDQNIGRFLGSTHGHHAEALWLYIPGFFAITLPWSPWLLVQIAGRLRHWKKKLTRMEILTLCWAGVGLILLSISANKRELYAYPLLPPAALLLAGFLGHREQLRGSRVWSLGWALIAALTVPTAMLATFFGYADYPSPWSCFLAGSLLAVIGFLSIHRLLLRPGGLGLPAFWIAPCLLFFQIAILYVPAAEPIVSHRPGMLKLATLIDPDETPVAYRFGETELGSFSFYTGRRVKLIKDQQDFGDYITRYPHKILLVRKMRWPFRQKPEDLGQQVIGSVPVGKDRHIYVLRLDKPIELR